MKNILEKIVAGVVFFIGLMAVIAGTRVLLGSSVPGYTVLPVLVSYNVFAGLVSILAGILIWKKHRFALLLSGIITVSHIGVLSSLLTIFNTAVAQESINTMIIRSAVWIILFLIVKKSFSASVLKKDES
jgi:hypothetical protein